MNIATGKMSFSPWAALLSLALLLPATVAAKPLTFEAQVVHIDKNYILVMLDNRKKKYELSNLFHPGTKYYNTNGRETSFETLYGVGYINKARITVEDNKVLRLEVIELHL